MTTQQTNNRSLLRGKTALITGGSRGIGEAIVRVFAQEGANIAFTYLNNVKNATAICQELQTDNDQQIKAYQSDASDYQATENLVKQVLQDFGKIDVLVNNAGIAQDGLLLRLSEDQWDQVIQSNLKSVFNLTKHTTKHFLRQRSGSIINISSVVGVRGNAGQVNYSASKAGIIGFTKSLSRELGSRQIRCNAIAPGFINTDMTSTLNDKTRQYYLDRIPMGRFGTSEEVAKAAVFLASDLSDYVSGQVISVCGGFL